MKKRNDNENGFPRWLKVYWLFCLLCLVAVFCAFAYFVFTHTGDKMPEVSRVVTGNETNIPLPPGTEGASIKPRNFTGAVK